MPGVSRALILESKATVAIPMDTVLMGACMFSFLSPVSTLIRQNADGEFMNTCRSFVPSSPFPSPSPTTVDPHEVADPRIGRHKDRIIIVTSDITRDADNGGDHCYILYRSLRS